LSEEASVVSETTPRPTPFAGDIVFNFFKDSVSYEHVHFSDTESFYPLHVTLKLPFVLVEEVNLVLATRRSFKHLRKVGSTVMAIRS
jgi:hypothetical protein